MSDAQVSANGTDEVILVGGSTRIPAVQDFASWPTGDKDVNMGESR